MGPLLIIVIVLPIIMTLVSVYPFEPPEIEEEEIPETLVDESPELTRDLIIITLAILWLFLVARMFRVWFIAMSKSSIRK